MRFIRTFLQDNWPAIALYGGLFVALGFLLFWQLGTLLPGYSGTEAATHQQALGITQLLDKPFNAPFLIGAKVLSYLNIDSPLAVRLVAVGGGLLTLGVFCWLLQRWYDMRTAFMGTLLFGTSAWFLHTARMGTPEIMFFGVFALFAAGYWLRQGGGWVALLACFALGTVFLYTPGMIWFVLVGLVWQWRTIDRIFKEHLLTVSIGAFLFLLLLTPLAWGLYRDSSLIMTWLGVPEAWPSAIEAGKRLLFLPYHLVVAGETNPVAWLGRAPVLDVFSVALFVIGGWLFLRRFRLLRTPIILSIFGVSIVLIVLGTGTISMLLPFLYVVIAAGAGYLLDQWLKVFPRNPIARVFGMSLVGLVLALTIGFHLRHYFIGWPQARATHAVYTVQPPQP